MSSLLAAWWISSSLGNTKSSVDSSGISWTSVVSTTLPWSSTGLSLKAPLRTLLLLLLLLEPEGCVSDPVETPMVIGYPSDSCSAIPIFSLVWKRDVTKIAPNRRRRCGRWINGRGWRRYLKTLVHFGITPFTRQMWSPSCLRGSEDVTCSERPLAWSQSSTSGLSSSPNNEDINSLRGTNIPSSPHKGIMWVDRKARSPTRLARGLCRFSRILQPPS